MDSILTSVKKDLGIVEEYTHFDPDIIMDINTAFSILTQLGVGPDTGFSITDDTTTWNDYISDPNSPVLNLVKTYISKKTRILFDPPLSSAVMESMNHVISELEWRINVAVDPKENNNEEELSL